MADQVEEAACRTDTATKLAEWFCRTIPSRAMVLQLRHQLVVAADPTTLQSLQPRAQAIPCALEALFTPGFIGRLVAQEAQGGIPDSDLQRELDFLGAPANWRYASVLPGELGVLFQCNATQTLETFPSAQESRDPLTGLSNRDALLRAIETSLASFRTSGKGFAVFFLDVDHFKRMNDDYGHLAGDEVLRSTAEGILHAIRPGDGAFRFGGDEMVLLIPNLHSPAEAAVVGHRVAGAIPKTIHFRSDSVPFTVSMGIAFCQSKDTSPQAILERADLAMYRAKARGRKGEIELD